LATVGDAGRPFPNSNLFVYDEPGNVIFMHTARLSRTRQNVERHERVCVSATEMGRLLPAPTALDFSARVRKRGCVRPRLGRSRRIRRHSRTAAPARHIRTHLEAGHDDRPPVSEEVRRTSVYRIDIDEWSGKHKAVAADFPGAFAYGAPPPV
jgi:nitroimidazol reductase NimA-like FMN-containing flavoprotein (pyridoxamine 5'-phosphate oxidase superfamily)